MADGLGRSFGLLLDGRTLGCLNGSGKGTGLGKLVGVDASNELSSHQYLSLL